MKVEIMYFGRPSEFLLMTSERLELADDITTLKQVVNKLRKRGDCWMNELDESHLICTVGRQPAILSDTVQEGDEIGIFSSKSIFQM